MNLTPVELNAYKRLCEALFMKWEKGEEDLAYVLGCAATRINRYEEELNEPTVRILVNQIRYLKEIKLKEKGVIKDLKDLTSYNFLVE